MTAMPEANDNSPAVYWALRIADAYAASLTSQPLDEASMDALRRDLAVQIEVGLSFRGSIWLLHANRVLDTWDDERGVKDNTVRIVESEGAFVMKPRNRGGTPDETAPTI